MPLFHQEEGRKGILGILVNDVRALEEHSHLGERAPFDLGSLKLSV